MRFRTRTIFLLAVVLTVIGFMGSSDRKALRKLTPNLLNENYRKWQNHRVQSYEYDLHFENSTAPVHVVVRDGLVSSLTENGKRVHLAEDMSIGGLFSTLELDIARHRSGTRVAPRPGSLLVNFHELWGFPQSYSRRVGKTDSTNWHVENFQAKREAE